MAHWIWNEINPQGYFTLELSCRQQYGILPPSVYKHTRTIWIFHLIGSCLCPRPHQKEVEKGKRASSMYKHTLLSERMENSPRTKPLNVPMTFSRSLLNIQLRFFLTYEKKCKQWNVDKKKILTLNFTSVCVWENFLYPPLISSNLVVRTGGDERKKRKVFFSDFLHESMNPARAFKSKSSFYFSFHNFLYFRTQQMTVLLFCVFLFFWQTLIMESG